jgi:hypothetical protein
VHPDERAHQCYKEKVIETHRGNLSFFLFSLSEKSQHQKATYYTISTTYSGKGEAMEIVKRFVFARV